MTDILFIHPGNQRKTYQDLANEFTAKAPPVWSSLIAGYLRRKNHAVAIYDANLLGWDVEATIEKHNPHLIVLMVYGHQPSSSTQTMPAAGRIARDIKDRYGNDMLIAMGGIHPSALPERTLREEYVDFVIQGEGPETLDQLIKHIKGQQKLHEVPGLWYREGDQIRHNTPAKIIDDLDQNLSDYAWDLLPDLTQYRAHNMHLFQEFKNSNTPDFSDVRSPYAVLYSSLGCPYNCSYCCINSLYGKRGIRYWSIDTTLSWIDHLVSRYQIQNIRFDDELFILSPDRIEKFCDRLIERNYKLNIWAYGRVDTIPDHLLQKLKQAGFNWICLGIESGVESVRQGVHKRIRGNIIDTVKSLKHHDIYVLGNYMFGLPDDTRETMENTFKLAVELNCEFINFYTVMAYPGSSFYNDDDMEKPANWAAYSQHSFEAKPMSTKYITDREVLQFRDQAFTKYIQNPRYQDLIRNTFGSQVNDHLNRMIKVKLKRKLYKS